MRRTVLALLLVALAAVVYAGRHPLEQALGVLGAARSHPSRPMGPAHPEGSSYPPSSPALPSTGASHPPPARAGASGTSPAGTSPSGAVPPGSSTTSPSPAGASTLPPTTPGWSTVQAFYQDLASGHAAQAYALLAPSLAQTYTASSLAQAYAGLTAVDIASARLWSAGNFTRSFALTLRLRYASGQTQTVSGLCTVTSGNGTWQILAFPTVSPPEAPASP